MIKYNKNIVINNNITNAKGIHKGLTTHHHDHVILFVNLSTKNTINNALHKLNPVPDPFITCTP